MLVVVLLGALLDVAAAARAGAAEPGPAVGPSPTSVLPLSGPGPR
jgi:hypothetical protein